MFYQNHLEFTIFGADGFIGSNLVKHLESQKIKCNVMNANDQKTFDKPLGHVIYAIGITSDFRKRPLETVKAHVCLLEDVLEKARFDSFLYLSSTRIYINSSSTKEEKPLLVEPLVFTDIFNISKIMGESICFSFDNKNIRVVRLSNVVGNNPGSDDFLPSIIKDAISKKNLILHTTSSSEKDYVHIDDVVKILPKISQMGKHTIYNIASGENTKVKEIIDEIKKITDCQVHFAPDAIEQSFPEINIRRVKEEFDFKPSHFLNKLKDIIYSESK